METVVPFWETDSLAMYLIENDLKHARLVQKCNELSMKKQNRSNIYESVFWLLGIFESEYQKKLIRQYKKERLQCDDLSISEKMYAEELFIHLKSSPKVEKFKLRQLTCDNNGIDRLIKNIIKNDLIFVHLYNSIDPKLQNPQYQSTLFKPLLWLLGEWDVRSNQSTGAFYFQVREHVNKIKLGRNNDELVVLATKIHRGIKSHIKNSTLEVKQLS